MAESGSNKHEPRRSGVLLSRMPHKDDVFRRSGRSQHAVPSAYIEVTHARFGNSRQFRRGR